MNYNRKQVEYTSFFNEETMNKHLKGLEESLNEDPNTVLNTNRNSIRESRRNLVTKNEEYSEESFDMDEDEEQIDLPFQEDELYSNILMEFLPRLKQEIVTDKVMKRKSGTGKNIK